MMKTLASSLLLLMLTMPYAMCESSPQHWYESQERWLHENVQVDRVEDRDNVSFSVNPMLVRNHLDVEKKSLKITLAVKIAL